jgi:chemotaxis protein CheD
MAAHAQREIVLSPGECFAGDAGCRVRTLLGSCVAITLWHPVRRIGAMSHYLLASRGRHDGPPDARYGDEALQMMEAALVRAGIALRDCEAQVVGGGNMFPSQPNPLNVGRANGRAAREMLRERGIPIRRENLFGVGHRLVMFDVATGQVWVRQVSPRGGSA